MQNQFDMGRIVQSEKVVCVLMLENDSVTFLNMTGEFGSLILAEYAPKNDVFELACQLSNWDDICGRVAFLNAKEVADLVNGVEKAA